MTLPPFRVCQRFLKLFAMLSSSHAAEADNARAQLFNLLSRHGLTWNDLPAILASADSANQGTSQAPPSDHSTSVPDVNVLGLVLRLIEERIAIEPSERMIVALWVLHSYVFDLFVITPRLVLVSPVRGCGKTTLLALLELLVAEPYRTDDVTAAAIYHQLDCRPKTTLLIDEADNLGLPGNRVLRSLFNSGHRRGGGISRFAHGESRKFPTFAPLAVAAIGMLPLPLMHRAAAVISMHRHAPSRNAQQIQALDENDPIFPDAREQIKRWAATCSLARDPEIPFPLSNRLADNWRVLLAIADDLRHGDEARSAAIEACANRLDEDPGVLLLIDIRRVFTARGIDRFSSSTLVEALLELDEGIWSEWCGPNDNHLPRKLTQGELAKMLRPFQIRPKTIWPAQRRPGDKSKRGYLRSQFEPVWDRYCSTANAANNQAKSFVTINSI
jgi:hypothetical protein